MGHALILLCDDDISMVGRCKRWCRNLVSRSYRGLQNPVKIEYTNGDHEVDYVDESSLKLVKLNFEEAERKRNQARKEAERKQQQAKKKYEKKLKKYNDNLEKFNKEYDEDSVQDILKELELDERRRRLITRLQGIQVTDGEPSSRN